ncbi:hypothetical protein GCM10009738_12230 [Kitasatospora viridis]|uniref:Methyltransferase family protein n=1 Tax=Kitasatospora viridis TaxID=281105 RepID=A0A561SAF5_9ACTN|nr:hypothetical protein FHX73_1755 [Kitasatospora viridis]
MGLDATRSRPGPRPVRYIEVLIGSPGWFAALDPDGPLDAAVSTTALHCPEPDTLREIHRDLAAALR